jgi:predicted small lipoprotein YifL
MKKVFTSILLGLLFILTFTLFACSDKGETYYPTNEEMKTNLEKNGYVVTLEQDISDSDGNRHYGTLLSANKDSADEYLYFYRFDNATSCEYYYNYLEQNCKKYNSLVKIENDEKFGNLVYCGTAQAIKDAGVTVVDVYVKV